MWPKDNLLCDSPIFHVHIEFREQCVILLIFGYIQKKNRISHNTKREKEKGPQKKTEFALRTFYVVYVFGFKVCFIWHCMWKWKQFLNCVVLILIWLSRIFLCVSRFTLKLKSMQSDSFNKNCLFGILFSLKDV